MKNIKEFQDIIKKITIKEAFFATNKPHPKNIKNIQITAGTRLIIPLAGIKNILIGNGKDIIELSLKKGQTLCIPPLCWDHPLWTTSHEMISIVFRTNCLRLLYINYNPETDPKYPLPEFIYHLWPGASVSTFHAMLALINSRTCSEQDLLSSFTTCLLHSINHDLQQMKDVNIGKALAKYLDISEYIHSNLQNQITRENIAKIFKITPQYVSNLFKTFAMKSFRDFLTSCRINHATILLLESDMTMDEIAVECNYNYTSHFIKMFKRQHGTSPAKYRLANKK